MTGVLRPVENRAAAAPVTGSDQALLLGVTLLSVALLTAGFWRWPWDHDEVLAFAELKLVAADHYVGPPEQLRRIATILPVWYYAQRAALSVLPHDEFGARALPVCAALVLVGVCAWWGRRRSVRLATGLVLMAGCSPMLVWLAQQNRFYSLALALLAGALFAAASERRGWVLDAATVMLGLAALLTHNLTFVVIVVAFVAAVITHVWGPREALLLRRTGALAAASLAVYAWYLRPALAGWVSGGTGGTLPLMSYVAQYGLGPVGVTILGAAFLLAADRRQRARWWLLTAAGCAVFVVSAPWLMRAWNPRYALFFMWPAWVVAAWGVAGVADRLESRMLRGAWVGAVLLMLAPKLLSHQVDGTRHDFRAAAAVVAAEGSRTVVSNWPATLQYYLEQDAPAHVGDWQPGGPAPSAPLTLVFASNAWEPVLRLPHRAATVIGEIRSRRFDEQSYVIRVYRVGQLQTAVAAHHP